MLSVPDINLMLYMDSVLHMQLSNVKREVTFASQFNRCVEYLKKAAVPEVYNEEIKYIIYKVYHTCKYLYNNLNRQYREMFSFKSNVIA